MIKLGMKINIMFLTPYVDTRNVSFSFRIDRIPPPKKKHFLPLPYQDPPTLPPNLRNDETIFFPGGPPLPRYLVQHEISTEVRGIMQIQLVLAKTWSRHFVIIVNSKGKEKNIMIDKFFGV